MNYWDDVGFPYQRPPGLINAPIRRDTRRKQLEEEQARRTYQGLLERDLIGIQQFSPFFGLNSRDPDAIPVAPMDVVPAGAIGKGLAGLIAAGTGGLLARQLMKQPVNRSSVSMMGYHGGPTKWAPEPDAPLGRPRLESVGEGEGAQAYGHGFYVAENPKVAGEYRRDLSGFDELVLTTSRGKLRGEQLDDVDLEVAKYLEFGERDAGQFKHNTVHWAKKQAEKAGRHDVVRRLDEYGPDARMGYERNTGSLYKMDVPDADVAKMLDYDAPLSEQTPAVQKIIREIYKDSWLRDQFTVGFSPGKKLDVLSQGEGRGQLIYESLQFILGSQERASKYLASKGIPGLRYLDQGSRTAKEGTRNMVIWDEDLLKRIKVLERQ